MSWHEKTNNAAKSKWRGILLSLGLPEECLRNKHGPCPLCQSKDNFRWDNANGSGSYICTCSAGDGMSLAMAFTGKTFAAQAAEIDQMLGNITPDTAPRPDMSDEDRRQILRATYAATKPIQPGDLADKYLNSRGLGDTSYPKSLRFGASLKDGDGGVRPCLVAMVTDAEGKPVTMHRTFLRGDGLAKAEMPSPRKLMPGELPDGACVRLSDGVAACLGVAEGVETALAASAIYGLPVWSALTAGMLARWIPPEGCEEVTIFGDNDAKFAGQAAAYALARRLATKGLLVTVKIPDRIGMDWADIWMEKR
jgi:putative DNA primase/helicase